MVNLTGLETAQLYQNQLKQYQDNAKGINDTMASLYKLKQEQDYATQKAAAEAAANRANYEAEINLLNKTGNLSDEVSNALLQDKGIATSVNYNAMSDNTKRNAEATSNMTALGAYENYGGFESFNNLPDEAKQRIYKQYQHIAKAEKGNQNIFAAGDVKTTSDKFAQQRGGGYGNRDSFILDQKEVNKLITHLAQNTKMNSSEIRNFLSQYFVGSENEKYKFVGMPPEIIMNARNDSIEYLTKQ